ncbi:VWA domain-containing protein [Meridianimarinicoccus roseus]|nr:VWA domain-containing protein [Meridianimarinicoccus roseus]
MSLHFAKFLTAPRGLVAAAAVALMGSMPGAASAAVSVVWDSPANNSTFTVGTVVAPLGRASATGVIGTGLDLSIVMDSSGSMFTSVTATDGNGNTVTKSRGAWQKEGALALVAGLPDTATVSIVEFDDNGTTVIGQTVLNAAGRLAVQAAINSVDESGGTVIGDGIDAAASNLLPGTPGFDQAMVVFSDGSTSGNPSINAATAVANGVETIDAVALPGAVISTMQGIASAGNGTFVDATSDIGLVNNLLAGLSGGLPIGLASLTVTTPDGTITPVTTGVGNIFQSPAFALNLGNNIFTATATDTDGNVAVATLNLIGVQAAIPLPAAGWLMLTVLGGGLGMSRLRRKS